jgi:hypothetical protein
MDFNTTSLRDAVQNACPGEKIRWVGKPATGLRFNRSDWFVVPFSLLWGGFALLFPVDVRSGAGPFLVIPIVFKVVGVYIIAGRFFVDMFRRSRTEYGLTDRSAVVISSSFGASTRVVDLHTLSEISLERGKSGEGSVVFGAQPSIFAGNNMRAWGGAPSAPTFEYIPNAAAVYQMALEGRGGISASPYQVAP